MSYRLIEGSCFDVLPTLAEKSVQCVVTSPPYFGLRDYGVAGQIGNEETMTEYIDNLVDIFNQVRRVLRDDGTLWLNLGDSYANDTKWGGATGGKHAKGLHGTTEIGRGRTKTGLPSKSLMGIPWRVAFALQDDGWILRSDIIWAKPNPMPESVTDRPTRSHEYIFLLTKSGRYYYDADAIKEPAKEHVGQAAGFARSGAVSEHVLPGQSAAQHRPDRVDKQRGHGRRHDGFNDRWDSMTKAEQCAGMRNKRDVWTVAPSQFADAHFATFPPALIEPCILAGSRPGDTLLDCFNGSGTTGAVSLEHHRQYIGIELNPAYIELSHQRIGRTQFALPML